MTNMPHPDVVPGVYLPSKERITEMIADYYSLSVEELHAKTRLNKIVEPRQLVVSICKYALSMTNEELAIDFGQTNATIVHARKCVMNFYKTNKTYRARVNAILEKIFLFEVDRIMIIGKITDPQMDRAKSHIPKMRNTLVA